MGKTALATNIAFNAAKKIQENGEKSSIAFFSLEMSSEQLSTRILAEQSRINQMIYEEEKFLKINLINLLKHQKIFQNCHYILMRRQQYQLLH